jgi:hypothetical protein
MTTETTDKLPITWADAVKAHKERQKALLQAVNSGPKFLSFQGGVLAIDGVDIPGNKLDVIVVAWVGHYVYYDRKFDPQNPTPPACYSFYDGVLPATPHVDVSHPVQALCEGCPMKEWGSDTLGDRGGRACKDLIRVALLPADEDTLATPESVRKAEIRYANIPVMSVSIFTEYLRKIDVTNGLPQFCFVTELSLVRDPVSQFKVHWNAHRLISDEQVLMALFERSQDEATKIGFPYRKEDSDTPAPAGNGGPARKSKM